MHPLTYLLYIFLYQKLGGKSCNWYRPKMTIINTILGVLKTSFVIGIEFLLSILAFSCLAILAKFAYLCVYIFFSFFAKDQTSKHSIFLQLGQAYAVIFSGKNSGLEILENSGKNDPMDGGGGGEKLCDPPPLSYMLIRAVMQ